MEVWPIPPYPARPADRLGRGRASCAHRKATGYLGYCFIADQAGRSVAVVDLGRFAVRGRIAWTPLRAWRFRIPAGRGLRAGAGDRHGVRDRRRLRSRSAGGLAPAARRWGAQLAPRGDALWVLYREPAALVEFPLESLTPARRVRLPRLRTGST